jgi:hypothetical protein
MIGLEIQLLKDNINKTVEIETIDGERLIARVLFVTYSEEYNEHNVLYEVVSSSTPEFYSRHKNPGGFVLDFDKIQSVKPHSDFGEPGATG